MCAEDWGTHASSSPFLLLLMSSPPPSIPPLRHTPSHSCPPPPTPPACRHQCGPPGARPGENLGRLHGTVAGRLQLQVPLASQCRRCCCSLALLLLLSCTCMHANEGAAFSDMNYHSNHVPPVYRPYCRTVTSKFNELVYQYPIRIPERYSLVIRWVLGGCLLWVLLCPDAAQPGTCSSCSAGQPAYRASARRGSLAHTCCSPACAPLPPCLQVAADPGGHLPDPGPSLPLLGGGIPLHCPQVGLFTRAGGVGAGWAAWWVGWECGRCGAIRSSWGLGRSYCMLPAAVGCTLARCRKHTVPQQSSC
jgi:hypothetical protein